MVIGVGKQRQKAGSFDSFGKLALVTRFGASNAAWNNLAGLSDVLLEDLEIFVIDLFYAFGSETAKLTTSEKT